MRNTLSIAGVSLLTLLSLSPAQATNGYFAHGFGVRSKAIAGAGSALPQDSLASAINPAGLAFVGTRVDVELELFSPRRQFSVEGSPTLAPDAFPLNPGQFYSSSEEFLIPTVGFSYAIDDDQSVGIALYGHGGMVTNFIPKANPLCPPGSPGAGVFCAGRTGVDLQQAFISPSYARRFFEGRLAVGIAPIFAIQSFKGRGFGGFAGFSSDASRLTDTGRDYAFGGGLRAGILAEPIDGLHIGLAYKSRIWMSEFDEYAGLFAEQGDFDIPDSYNLGLAYQVNTQLALAFDLEHIRYSQIKSVGNRFLPNLQTARLGDTGGAGFGWRDMTIYKFGAVWQPDDAWTLRAGFSYGRQPIPKSEVLFNIVAPGVQEWHITAGFSRKLWDHDEVSFAFMYSPEKSVKGI
ncbi:MAG: outer membrane protein transport protein, partial [Methylococcales bacterium]|nr:outer membrane protein transport protein [Methylococcales bacterium]